MKSTKTKKSIYIMMSTVLAIVMLFTIAPITVFAQLDLSIHPSAAEVITLGTPVQIGQPAGSEKVYFGYIWKKFRVEKPSDVTITVTVPDGKTGTSPSGGWYNQLEAAFYAPNTNQEFWWYNNSGSGWNVAAASSTGNPLTDTQTFKVLPNEPEEYYYLRLYGGSDGAGHSGNGTVKIDVTPITGNPVYSPNKLKAVKLTLNKDVKGITRYRGLKNGNDYGALDYNYFKYDAASAGTVKLTFSRLDKDRTNKIWVKVEDIYSFTEMNSENDPGPLSQNVTFPNKGTYYIVVGGFSGHNGKPTEFNLKLSSIPVTKISLNKSKLNLKKGASFTLIPKFTPAKPTNTSVTWKSSNTKVATVNKSSGVVSAKKKKGTAIITAKTSNGKTAKCTVKVK